MSATLLVPETSVFEDIDAVVRAHRSRIFRFLLLAVKDVDIAETLTQDCFRKAYRTRHSFRGECAASTWLIRIAYNLLRDHTRTERYKFWKRALGTSPEVSAMADLLPEQARSPEDRVLARERLQATLQYVQQLPEQQRCIFLLHFLDEMTVTEIAESLGMPLSTAKTHLYRALGKVRAAMLADGGSR